MTEQAEGLREQVEDIARRVERLRHISPELARKIGGSVSEVLDILAIIRQLATMDGLPSIEQEAPEALQSAHPVAQTRELPVTPYDRSPKGRQWLIQELGENWAEKLGLDPGATNDEIASKIAVSIPIRRPNTVERATARIAARLSGQTLAEVARLEGHGNVANLSQFFIRMAAALQGGVAPKPVSKRSPVSLPTITEDPEDEDVIIGDRDDSPDYLEDVLPMSTPEGRALSRPEDPVHIQLSDRIATQLGLDESRRFAIQAFLDPKSRGEMTVSKLEAVEIVRDFIRTKLDDPQNGLTPAERQWLIKSFGIYNFMGKPQDVEPIPIAQLSSSVRRADQQKDIPDFVYAALEKLFVTQEVQRKALDRFILAVADPGAVSEEEFYSLRDSLFSDLVEKEGFSREQAAALAGRSRFGERNEHQVVSDELKSALRKVEQRVVLAGGVNSGDPLVDHVLKKFLSPNFISSHLDAIRSELPSDDQVDPQVIERIIVAGIHSVYKQTQEEAA